MPVVSRHLEQYLDLVTQAQHTCILAPITQIQVSLSSFVRGQDSESQRACSITYGGHEGLIGNDSRRV